MSFAKRLCVNRSVSDRGFRQLYTSLIALPHRSTGQAKKLLSKYPLEFLLDGLGCRAVFDGSNLESDARCETYLLMYIFSNAGDSTSIGFKDVVTRLMTTTRGSSEGLANYQRRVAGVWAQGRRSDCGNLLDWCSRNVPHVFERASSRLRWEEVLEEYEILLPNTDRQSNLELHVGAHRPSGFSCAPSSAQRSVSPTSWGSVLAPPGVCSATLMDRTVAFHSKKTPTRPILEAVPKDVDFARAFRDFVAATLATPLTRRTSVAELC